VKTSFSGPFHTKGCSMLAPFTISLFVMMAFLSLEEYLADQDSFESSFFCLVGGSREHPYHGQP
jgi:hypothetical protein